MIIIILKQRLWEHALTYYVAYSVTGRYRKPEANSPVVLIQAEPPVWAGYSNFTGPNLTYLITDAFSFTVLKTSDIASVIYAGLI